MKIQLIQHDIRWAEPKANTAHLDEILDTTDKADLYILPEMFSTGFAIEPAGVAEPFPDSPTLCWMQATALRLRAAVAGSVAVCEAGRYFNRLFLVHPDGNTIHYDKHHLFTYGGETRYYTPGQHHALATVCGVRLLLLTCYDLRFPLWSRQHTVAHAAGAAGVPASAVDADCAYDVIVYVANWPQSRRTAWDTLLRARAIENQCYVAGVNRIGDDPACHYNGGTAIIDPYGRTLATCADDSEDVVTATIDMDRLHSFRAKFPVLADAD